MILVGVYGLAPTDLDLVKVVPVTDETIVEMDNLLLKEGEGKTEKSATDGGTSVGNSSNTPHEDIENGKSVSFPATPIGPGSEKDLHGEQPNELSTAVTVKSKRKIVKRPSSPQVSAIDPTLKS